MVIGENARVVVMQDLVNGWWEYQRRLQGTQEERRALEAGHPASVYISWTDVNAAVTRGGLLALELVNAIIQAAPDESGVVLVGAGPLEDLVRKHSPNLIDEIERMATRDSRFRLALSSAWLPSGVHAPAVEMRLSRLTA